MDKFQGNVNSLETWNRVTAYTWASEGFFPGGALGDFSKIFPGGPKVLKFGFPTRN